MKTAQMEALQKTTRALADMVFYEWMMYKSDEPMYEHLGNAYRALVTTASELETIANQYEYQYKKTNPIIRED